MAEKTSRITEQVRESLFLHLDRYRVGGMDQGAQLCVLCDATERFLNSFGSGLEMTETNQLVREYLEKKQATSALPRMNWHEIWNSQIKKIGRVSSKKRANQSVKSEQKM